MGLTANRLIIIQLIERGRFNLTTVYGDIITEHRPRSSHYPMPRAHRAKQFAPFAALKGYEESIQDAKLLYQTRVELAEEYREMIDYDNLP